MLPKSLNKPLNAGITLIFIVLIGFYSFSKLPIAFLPEISRPTLTIQTTWPGHSAEQVMQKLIVPQETQLRGIPDLYEISSMAYAGLAEIVITFRYNTEINDSYMYALQAINRVSYRPTDALPTLIEKSGEMQRMAFLFVQAEKNNHQHIDDYQAVIDKHILPVIQSIEGVSHTKLMLASEDELQVEIDINALKKYDLTISDVIELLSANKITSLGSMKLGKHSYQLMFDAKYSINQLKNKPILSNRSASVVLADIASITRARSDRRHFVLQNGRPAIGIDIYKSKNANMLGALDLLYQKVDQLNSEAMPGYGLRIEKSFDPTVFIKRAINLISSNLVLGIFLAAIGLLLFSRNIRLIISIFFTIPVTLLAVFSALSLLGKSLNIISLAAIALATGIILDASIVVLSAIQNELKNQASITQAIEKGLNKVVKALLCSTLTSIVIFAPIFVIDSFEGQLFRDLALTLSLSIMFSLFVSLFLFPCLFRIAPSLLTEEIRFNWIKKLEARLVNFSLTISNRLWFLVSIFLLTIASFKFLLPEMDLLPPVKRDVVDNLLIMPKGQNLEQVEQNLGNLIHSRLAPHLNKQKKPYIKDYYLAISVDFSSLGVRPLIKSETEQLKQALTDNILKDLPGTEVVTYQAGIFGAMKSSRTVTVNLFSENIDLLNTAVSQTIEDITQLSPGLSAYASPTVKTDMPILTIKPDFKVLNQYQIPVSKVIEIIQTTGAGLHLGRISEAGRMLDVRVKVNSGENFESLLSLPIAGTPLSLRDLVSIDTGVTMSELMHVNFKNAISVTINVPDDKSIEQVSTVAQKVVKKVNQEILGSEGHAKLSGSSDLLATAIERLLSNLLFAAVVFFAILLVVFQRFDYSLMILLCLPVAFIGSLFGLQLSALFFPQQLDLLTMMGFLILIGLIVNNAILLVDAFITANASSAEEKIAIAFAQRLQPILMSTVTSIIGMLPLAILPGAGNELYRGLGVVLVGGMSVGGLILLIVIPGLLLFYDKHQVQFSLLTKNGQLRVSE